MSETIEQELSFSDRLYEGIGNLSFWADDEVNADSNGVTFMMKNICNKPGFNAVGNYSLVDTDSENPVEFASFYLILAKNVDAGKMKYIIPELYEMNLNYRNGVFVVDEPGNICFEARVPVPRDDLESAIQAFAAEYMEISDYLDAFYPFILRLAAKPEEASFNNYLKTLFEYTANLGE